MMTIRAKSRARKARGGQSHDESGKRLTLRLYVAGTTPLSTRAIMDARTICEQHLGAKYRLEVVDIFQRPQLAKNEQIIAVPTLVKRLPPPLRKLVGDLSNAERVLVGLDIQADNGTRPRES